VRERAIRLFVEHRHEYPTEWSAMTAIASKLGMTAETLRSWVRRAEVDQGERPGLTTDERARLKELEKENKELRRANEILKDASILFATELDGPTEQVVAYVDARRGRRGTRDPGRASRTSNGRR
jgi:transposase